MIHGLRDRPSNRALPLELREKALAKAREETGLAVLTEIITLRSTPRRLAKLVHRIRAVTLAMLAPGRGETLWALYGLIDRTGSDYRALLEQSGGLPHGGLVDQLGRARLERVRAQQVDAVAGTDLGQHRGRIGQVGERRHLVGDFEPEVGEIMIQRSVPVHGALLGLIVSLHWFLSGERQ